MADSFHGSLSCSGWIAYGTGDSMDVNTKARPVNYYDDSKRPILRDGLKNHWKFSVNCHKTSDR
jgi:hypothetical protein